MNYEFTNNRLREVLVNVIFSLLLNKNFYYCINYIYAEVVLSFTAFRIICLICSQILSFQFGKLGYPEQVVGLGKRFFVFSIASFPNIY